MMGAGGFHSTGAAGAGGVLSLADACAVPFGAVPVAPVAGPVLEAAAAGANGLDAAAFNATAGGFDAGCADAAATGGIDFLGTGGAAAEAMAGAVAGASDVCAGQWAQAAVAGAGMVCAGDAATGVAAAADAEMQAMVAAADKASKGNAFTW